MVAGPAQPERPPLASDPSHGLVFFDGNCLLCQASVRFLLPRDRDRRLLFASIQSEAAARAFREAGIDLPRIPGDAPGSILLLQHGRVFRRSSAALRILRAVGPPWSLLSSLLLVPAPVRDWVYDFVARRRYRWFGRSETCMVPPADYDQRFLDAAERPRIGPTA